jgi:hypothetical protein
MYKNPNRIENHIRGEKKRKELFANKRLANNIVQAEAGYKAEAFMHNTFVMLGLAKPRIHHAD